MVLHLGWPSFGFSYPVIMGNGPEGTQEEDIFQTALTVEDWKGSPRG